MITDTKATIETFIPGDTVQYIPNHAGGNTQHPDCEYGIVWNYKSEIFQEDSYVFVRYISKSGILQETPVGTDPTNLIHWNPFCS